MEKCLTCKKEFKTLKGLHGHLRVHGGVASYYQTHFPRFDLYDGALIDFKNKEEYFKTYFNSEENRYKFYNDIRNKKKAGKYIIKEIQANADFKEFNFLPSHNYLSFSKLPNLALIKRHFDSCKEFSEKSGLKLIFDKRLPKTFWTKSHFPSLEVFVDTREQQPFKFDKSIVNKLDFGDYTASGEFFSKTFIERKAVGDFCSSFGSGYTRLEKELRRAKDFNSYIVMVVEGSIRDIEKNLEKLARKGANASFVFHNVRASLIDFAENFQIVFCPNRLAAQDLSKRVLYFGDDIKRADLQYHLDQYYQLA